MNAEFVRDAAATGPILGFFVSSWFGWGLDDRPPPWRAGLITGAVVSVAVAVAGGVLTRQHWSDGTVFDPTTGRSFGVVVGIEVALAGLGSWLLSRRKRSELIPPWIVMVVGVHFFPLGALLRYPMLYVLGALLTLAAVATVRLARGGSLPIGALAGAMSGSILLVAALSSLVTVWA